MTLPYLAPTLFLSGLIAVIQSFKVFRELYILFGAYPNPHLYLLQHYMNNQFSSLNLQKLSGGITHSLCTDGGGDFAYLFDAEAAK